MLCYVFQQKFLFHTFKMFVTFEPFLHPFPTCCSLCQSSWHWMAQGARVSSKTQAMKTIFLQPKAPLAKMVFFLKFPHWDIEMIYKCIIFFSVWKFFALMSILSSIALLASNYLQCFSIFHIEKFKIKWQNLVYWLPASVIEVQAFTSL